MQPRMHLRSTRGLPSLAWLLVGLSLAGLSTRSLYAAKAAAAPVAAPTTSSTSATKAATAPTKAEKEANPDRPAPVGEGDRLSFEQEKVAAEMAELEERMYRLSESLKKLEPENSSRLMLGLKYAREELILHQMREAKEVLNKLKLSDAVNAQKDLLVKLERLEQLLLSSDLDLQLRLERVRLLREVIRRLDKTIKEQESEKRASESLASAQKKLDGLRKRQQSLEAIIKQQTKHLEDGQALAKSPPPAAELKEPAAKLSADQQKTRQDTQVLAKVQSAAPDDKNLDQASEKMQEAVASLSKNEVGKAAPPMQAALGLLEKELATAKAERKALEAKVAEARFAALKKEQAGTRESTDATTELARQLAEMGAGAVSELTRASGSMSSAESKLGSMKAQGAGEDQGRAVASLRYAKEQLEDQLQQLLDELRGEVKRKVMESVQWMLEKQVEVRQATAAQGKRVKEGSRVALHSVVALAKTESKIIAVAEEAIGLVEETEFGIALPAALTAIRDSMDGVRDSLERGDASQAVVKEEKEIESDLIALMGAMKQLPSAGPKGNENNGNGGGQREDERELNRMIAELKLVKLLQLKVNRGTQEVDSSRPREQKTLPVTLRKQVEELTGRQEDIRDVTERLATERDLQQ